MALTPLSSPGIGSGLDINGLVSKLMAVEQRPLTLLDTKEASLQAKLSAYGSLKGALASFQSAAAALATPAKFSALKASVADDTLFSASAAAGASPGRYEIEVQSLAQAQKLKSGTFATLDETVGSGTLTIQFGTYCGGSFTLNPDKSTQTITLGSADASLAGVRDAINKADVGVRASIINDGTGNRLVIASNSGGLANALKISVADDDGNDTDGAGLSRLTFDASSGGTMNLTQTVAAQDAVAVIDGITVSNASNTIRGALEGVTLNLAKTGTTTLEVTRDNAGVQSAIEAFVKGYNDLNKTLGDLSRYNADTKQASVLTGDSTLRSVQSQLRAVFNNALATAGGGMSTLSEIGLGFQKDGTLRLDSTKLNAALNDPTRDVATLFAAVGKPSDSLMAFSSATADTKNGRYAVEITQLATRGTAAGSTTAALTITAGVNDTLDFTVDGVLGSITLAAGTYTADSLAAELQSRINGALSSSGPAVTVTQSGGVLSVASDRYGAVSSVSIGGGSALADLFGAPVQTAGLDVAGTIGGFSASGSGRTLTGSGDAAGLTIEVSGGATGDRGTIDFARGYATLLDKLVEGMLKTDGLINGRIGGVNASIQALGPQREALGRRLDLIEKRYRAQFTALDAMVASMTQTSTFLQQQLANLPGSSKSK